METKKSRQPRLVFSACLLLVVMLPFSISGMGRPKAKNVIVLIVDGCSSEQYTLARWYKRVPLSFDSLLVGALKTYISDSVVADSAPAASAFATGVRTSNKFISIGPREKTIPPVPKPPQELRYRPLATVLEGARLLGKSTGIVATSRVSHATPAAYMAHAPSRVMENDIMEQAVYQNIDVVFGGGRDQLVPKELKGQRKDREDLLAVLQEKGYRIIATRNQLNAVNFGKVFGMFAEDHMAAEVDRQQVAPSQPTLAEMTAKAIEILAKDPDGFFLMVEASQVDWACHANDPAHLIGDLLMFDKAAEIAVNFAQKDGSTLVLVLSDHNTGGFTVGNMATNSSYSQMSPDALLQPLRNMTASTPVMWQRVGNEKTPAKVKAVVKSDWGLEITDEDAARILQLAETYKSAPHNAFGEVICARYTNFGWTSHGHVGGDVPLFAYGPAKPTGLLDGPDIGRVSADALGLDLNRLNRRLFVDAEAVLPGAAIAVDKTDPENPFLQIEYRGRNAQLPINKNLLLLGGKTVELEGVVVYVRDTNKSYVPLQAVNIIKDITEPLPSVTTGDS